MPRRFRREEAHRSESGPRIGCITEDKRCGKELGPPSTVTIDDTFVDDPDLTDTVTEHFDIATLREAMGAKEKNEKQQQEKQDRRERRQEKEAAREEARLRRIAQGKAGPRDTYLLHASVEEGGVVSIMAECYRACQKC